MAFLSIHPILTSERSRSNISQPFWEDAEIGLAMRWKNSADQRATTAAKRDFKRAAILQSQPRGGSE
jgi:hypothetical protein